MPTAVHATPLLNVGQVAEFLNVTVYTVRRYTRNGKLKSCRLPGGGHRYRREDVEALMTIEGAT